MDEKEKLWEVVKDQLEMVVSPTNFNMLISLSNISDIEDENITINTPNVFIQNNIEKKCSSEIIKALKNNGFKNPILHFSTSLVKKDTSAQNKSKDIKEQKEEFIPVKKPVGDGINIKFTFNNYIIGSNNELASAAGQRVAEQPGKIYNPLFIYGGVGLGKTHLIQAIGNKIKENHPKIKVRYITSEEFLNDYTSSIRTKNMSAFQEKYRKSTDVLIIDDIQFLAGKEKIEEEFFNTFNTFHLNDKQVIIAADRHPSTISGLTDRLQSRLLMGMTVDIHMPPYEVRIAIIQSKAREKGMEISDEAVRFLAENIRTNVRELEGVLTPIFAQCEFQNITVDLELARSFLNGMQITKTSHISPRQIIIKTAKYFNIKYDDICSPARDKHIAMPRHICVFLMRNELKMSRVMIGKELGGRDNSTIIHSERKITKEIQLDSDLREKINDIRNLLYA